MIVTQPELKELVTAEQQKEYYVGLTAETIYEFRTNLWLKGYEWNRGVTQEVETYNGSWSLQSGKPYLVEFNERVSLPDGYVPVILPSSLALEVGLGVYPKLDTLHTMDTLLVSHSPVEVEQDSILGVMVILNVLNTPARTETKAGKGDEDEDNKQDG